MTRLVLLVILGLVTWYYFPETRAILLDVAQPVVLPMLRWGVQDEMAQIARNAVDHERLTGRMPGGAAWLEWLRYRYATEEARTDPWGTTYQLVTSKDSVWVLSLGPDRTRETEDDFAVSAPRR